MSSPGTSPSMGRVLVVCGDTAAIQQLSEGMQKLAITAEVYADVGLALRLLDRKKFEAIVVDLALAQSEQMLDQVRLSPANQTAVTFAMTGPGLPAKFASQPNFVMEKPLSAQVVDRTLKAAFGLIVRERRRYFRCPTAADATIQSDARKASCHLVNISEGGMALTKSPSLKPGEQVRVQFTLPGAPVNFSVESEVCWFDDHGRAGLRSLSMPPAHKSALQMWLAARLEEGLPEEVARRFQKR